MADTKASALTETSVPDLADVIYSVDVSDTTDGAGGSSRKVTLKRGLGLLNHVCQGRLTLTTATPVTTTDVTGATTIYWTPYNGSNVAIYDGTRWQLYAFTEKSLALGTLTSGANYDVFLYDNAGTLTLKLGPAWTSDTARGTGAGTTELTTQDGVYVNNVSIASGPGAKAGRYLGSIRTTSTTTTEDSGGGTTSQVGGKRFVFNAYNQVQRPLGVIDKTSSWTYNSVTVRQTNAASGNKVEVLAGLVGPVIRLSVHGLHSSTSFNNVSGGIGVDVTNAIDAACVGIYDHNIASNSVVTGATTYAAYVPLGYHAYNWVESTIGGSCTIYGWSAGVYQEGVAGTVTL